MSTKYHTAENFGWSKISLSPTTFVLQKHLNFRPCSKGRHGFYIINTGQKIQSGDKKVKFSPGENLAIRCCSLHRIGTGLMKSNIR